MQHIFMVRFLLLVIYGKWVKKCFCSTTLPIAAIHKATSFTNLSTALFSATPDSTMEAMKRRIKELKDLAKEEGWHINPDSLQLRLEGQICLLGMGGFGAVVAGTLFGAAVAVKLALPDAAGCTIHFVSGLCPELRLMRHLRHPNLASFFGACILETGALLIVEELIQGHTLHALVEQRKLLAHTVAPTLHEICSALCYLHAQDPPVVHGDLKPGNVLVNTDTLEVKLIDFGLARRTGKTVAGSTLRWRAPEQGRKKVVATPMDMFSFGYIVYFATTGRTPYGKLPENEIQSKRQAGILGLDWPPDSQEDSSMLAFESQARRLCEACCVLHPLGRLSAQQAYRELERWTRYTSNKASPPQSKGDELAPQTLGKQSGPDVQAEPIPENVEAQSHPGSLGQDASLSPEGSETRLTLDIMGILQAVNDRVAQKKARVAHKSAVLNTKKPFKSKPLQL